MILILAILFEPPVKPVDKRFGPDIDNDGIRDLVPDKPVAIFVKIEGYVPSQ